MSSFWESFYFLWSSSSLGSSLFWGCLNIWGHFPFWGDLKFLDCLHLLGCLHFQSHLLFLKSTLFLRLSSSSMLSAFLRSSSKSYYAWHCIISHLVVIVNETSLIANWNRQANLSIGTLAPPKNHVWTHIKSKKTSSV